MGQGADEVEGVVEASDCGFSLEEDAQSLDDRGRPLGEVGQGVLFDGSAFAPPFAQEDGGRRTAVGNGIDIHGNLYSACPENP